MKFTCAAHPRAAASWRPRTLLLVALSSLLLASSAHAVVKGVPASLPGLTQVSDARWDATAVRKVLRTFAFGGHATDTQIDAWAALKPELAIVQMLTFNEHNLLLSPVDASLPKEAMHKRPQTLRALGNLWATNNSANMLEPEDRADYARSSWHGAMLTWSLAARVRGGNPFRHRIGYWETNFHLAVSHARGVSNYQLVRYYDDVMASLARGDSYDAVIATSALSAAIGQHYGHRDNRYYDGVCYCNEDFAREFHQLGFGILGVGDQRYHERVTIKNTAAALTGMYFVSSETRNEWEAEKVVFGTNGHVPKALPILHHTIAGANSRDKIRTLARFDINYKESLANLPVMIVQSIADDNVSAQEAAALRRAWASMADKDLLRFLRAYAISTQFHSATRVKQLTSLERHMVIANRFADTNREQYHDIPELWRLYWEEEVIPFEPWHEVFGHQNGPETAGSAALFRKNYKRATDASFSYSVEDFNDTPRAKDWRRLMPKGRGYFVGTSAAWLWQRFVADGLKNFGPLERAHLYALLAYGRDLGAVLHPRFPDTAVTLAELNAPAGKAWLAKVAAARLPLESKDADIRERTNDRIGAALDFIIATPFMLAEEGR
ncbi:MAG: hypothetical protein IPG43_12755 [Proteobacteria bacterium]|nr:hypothetical protein [Pseudomonadota bacterium]